MMITQTQGLILKAYPKPRGLLNLFFVIPAIKDENKFTLSLKENKCYKLKWVTVNIKVSQNKGLINI